MNFSDPSLWPANFDDFAASIDPVHTNLSPLQAMLQYQTSVMLDANSKPVRAHNFYHGELQMCGCGNPRNVQSMMLECLRAFSTDEMKDAAFEDRGVSLIEKIITANPAVAAEMIAQFLDSRELLEHGGTVFGSWLSQKGKDVLDAGPIDGLTYGEDEDGNVWASY